MDIERINKVYEFLDNIFSNLEVKRSDEYPDSIFYMFNHEIVAEYKKIDDYFYFYYHHDKIYHILSSKFKINKRNNINELIDIMLKKYLDINMDVNNIYGVKFDTWTWNMLAW